MPKFSERSMSKLETCDPALQKVFLEVVKTFDCTVFTGRRGKEQQDELFRQGKSQVKFPFSMHNTYPSKAADVAPYPIDWKDRERAYYFAGYVLGIAQSMGIKLRFGGDWDGDWEVKDNSFDDLWHFELITV